MNQREKELEAIRQKHGLWLYAFRAEKDSMKGADAPALSDFGFRAYVAFANGNIFAKTADEALQRLATTYAGCRLEIGPWRHSDMIWWHDNEDLVAGLMAFHREAEAKELAEAVNIESSNIKSARRL